MTLRPTRDESSRVVSVILIASLAVSLLTIPQVVADRAQPISAPAAAPQQLSDADWAQVSAAMYAGRREGQGVAFTNHANGLEARLEAGRTTVTIGAGDVTLRTSRFGRGDALAPVHAATDPVLDGTRSEWMNATGAGSFVEWWRNERSGLEQGFDLSSRPAGEGELWVALEVAGSLEPSVTSPGEVTFAGSELRFGGLRAWDSLGVELPTRFELRGDQLAIVTDDEHATYPITIDPSFAQHGYLKPIRTAGDDRLGWAVANYADTVVVGAYREDSSATSVDGSHYNKGSAESGAAFVFARSGSAFIQQAYLKAPNNGSGDNFGHSVAITATTIVIGAPNEDSSGTGVNSGTGSDNAAASSGAAYVFVRDGAYWDFQAYLKASNTDTNDRFGSSVAIDGDTIIVGAPGEDSSGTGINGPDQASDTAGQSGAAYVFKRSGTTWTQEAYVKASNTDAGDEFGTAVAVDGDTAVVGAAFEKSNATGVGGAEADDSLTGAGAAYVFGRAGSVWSQQGYLKSAASQADGLFGLSVAVDGPTVVVGSPGHISGKGAAFVFAWNGTAWTPEYTLLADNGESSDLFGYSVGVAGDRAVVGAYTEDSATGGVALTGATDNGASNAGAAYVFLRTASVWALEAYLKPSNTDQGDNFGFSVGISTTGAGTFVVVGAPLEASNTARIDGDETDDSAPQSGASYMYRYSTGVWTQTHYIKANTASYDSFGSALDVDGDTLVVAMPGEDSNATSSSGNQGNDAASGAGAAYAFVRVGALWTPAAYLKSPDSEAGGLFGASVAVDGDTIVVGAPFEGVGGAAHVFIRNGSAWSHQATLTPTISDSGDRFGGAVDIDGEYAIVGASTEDSNATGVGGNAGDNSMARAGAAYVFARSGTTWTQQAYLKASNTDDNDEFGDAVAISGTTALVGAPFEDSDGTGSVAGNELATDSGAAYLYTRSGSTWSLLASLKASNTDGNDLFGRSVAIDGALLTVGAPWEDSGGQGVNSNTQGDNSAFSAGAAYVFVRTGGVWGQEAYVKASNTDPNDHFGGAVALSGDMLVVGAEGESSNSVNAQSDDSLLDAGAAYAFDRASGGVWTQVRYIKPTIVGEMDNFGSAAAVDGNTIAIGAIDEDSDATKVAGDALNDGATNTGAAYTFGLLDDCTSAPFTDVTATQAFCREITWMKDVGISTGFGDGSYQPAANVTRQAMSAFMARLANATLTPCASAPFTDVQTSHPFCSEIQWMKQRGISTGFEDGTYRPSQAVTRQAMAAFLARLARATLVPCTSAPFGDVGGAHPFCPEIKWMKDYGLTTGFGGGNYAPAANVTRQAMSAFMFRAAGLVVSD